MPTSVHVFGADDPAAWAATRLGPVTQHPPGRPDAATVAAARAGGALFVRGDLLRPDDLEACDATAEAVLLLLADPLAAAGGRGSADLVADLFRLAPAVAAWLGDCPLDAGGVYLPAAATPEAAGGVDPLLAAIGTLLAGGDRVAAATLPRSDATDAPPDPPPLAPQPSRNRALADLIRQADPGRRLGGRGDAADAEAVLAGLLLWHGLSDESHAVAQGVEGQGRRRAGDAWHAILHRRERDYGNAKYWFRRVGTHPAFEALPARAARHAGDDPAGKTLLSRVAPGGRWDAAAFVDACAESGRSGPGNLFLRRVQSDEMLLLLSATVRDALG